MAEQDVDDADMSRDGRELPLHAPESGLLQHAVEDDALSFTKHYLATMTSLRAYLGSFLRDHAAVEDCLQETCLVLWNKRQPHWSEEDFRKVAFTSARFKALSWLKKNKPAKHLSLSPELSERLAVLAAQADDSGDDHRSDRTEALRVCMDGLPERQRALIEARYDANQENALQKLSKQQNRTMAAIYKQLERIRTALRQCVERRAEKDRV
ncbi:sigma-70 family RNA polymerase sigma factor [Verrucomicrobiaceae bacterium N1E253]|uniref:Sigma-70 family RNA polymerase sigma factor n=1 Tax=Oceaniferula marina TaxID=2748318 RepID=A0A851GC65_9BACT|nr:sigma-70 family RNA polymerase sigma factor [Oceaniferula marina]NWK55016.1 sigma-70 family RNA polymerase sigma factor [Oceaniferula marina]